MSKPKEDNKFVTQWRELNALLEAAGKPDLGFGDARFLLVQKGLNAIDAFNAL